MKFGSGRSGGKACGQSIIGVVVFVGGVVDYHVWVHLDYDIHVRLNRRLFFGGDRVSVIQTSGRPYRSGELREGFRRSIHYLCFVILRLEVS
jgi:hypothetical protein